MPITFRGPVSVHRITVQSDGFRVNFGERHGLRVTASGFSPNSSLQLRLATTEDLLGVSLRGLFRLSEPITLSYFNRQASGMDPRATLTQARFASEQSSHWASDASRPRERATSRIRRFVRKLPES